MSKEKLKNRMYNSNKGVTLVALIITIIVMLILVGVTLNIALGDNGIVNNAKKAAEETRRAMYKEELLSMVFGVYDYEADYIDADNLKDAIVKKGWSYSDVSNTSVIEVRDNENRFIAYVNVTTGYIGDNNIELNGSIEEVLTGTYIGDISFEIQNNNTFILGETSYPLTIDSTNKTVTVNMGSNNIVFNYEIIKHNGKVINIVLLTGENIYYQSNEGLDFELDGDYINSNLRLRFNATNGTVSRVVVDSETGKETIGNGELNMLYCGYKGQYYIGGNKVEVSDDLKEVTYDHKIYSK